MPELSFTLYFFDILSYFDIFTLAVWNILLRLIMFFFYNKHVLIDNDIDTHTYTRARVHTHTHTHTYTHTHTHTHAYIYIYIYRERERGGVDRLRETEK